MYVFTEYEPVKLIYWYQNAATYSKNYKTLAAQV